jgi:hypothetical protein
MRGRCPLNSVCGLHARGLILPDETTGHDGLAGTVNHVVSRLGARRDRPVPPLQTAGVHPAPARSGHGHFWREGHIKGHGGESRACLPACAHGALAERLIRGVQISTVRQCPHLQCGQRAR